MLQKTVKLGNQEVTFKSSAAIPRMYRVKFGRDIFKDLSKLEASYKGKTDDGEELQIEDLEIFENVAYIMAWHADPTIPDSIDEFTDSLWNALDADNKISLYVRYIDLADASFEDRLINKNQ